MNFSCTQQELLYGIQTVQKAVHKTPSPFQQYIYIETSGASVRLVSTSPDNTVIVVINAIVSSSGRILVPVAILRDIVSKMPDVTINLQTDENNLMTVTYQSMRYSIQCASSASFTFPENIDSDTEFTLSTEEFKKSVSQTYFTASTQETRPTLNGILLKCQHGKIDFVSTDGTRVAIKTISINEDISFDIIIPARFIHDILNSQLKSNCDISRITFNGKYMKYQSDNITVITGLISGKFINYKSILPHDKSTTMMCNRSEFLNILERAFLLSDENLYTVKFDINYSKLFVSSNSVQGEAFEEIYVKTEGAPVTIAFNSKSFIEILKNIEYEQLVFEFTTGTRICKIYPLENENLLYLISPIRI